MLLRIAFIVLTFLVAAGLGVIVRRFLIERLKNTFLDNWLIQTFSVIAIILLLILATSVSLVIWSSDLVGAVWSAIKTNLHITGLQDFVPTGVSLLQTILIIVLGIGVARTAVKVAVHGLESNRIDINIRTLIGRICYIITLIIVVFWTLAIWHIAIELPVAVLGTLTVAFTFAIQDILKDLVAGFYILLERPFHIGDEITIGDETKEASHVGRVEDVQIRATKLRLVSGEQVTVPNALVFGGIVINNSYYGERRATITAAIPQEEYKQGTTQDQLISLLKEIETVMPKPEPVIFLSSIVENKITLTIHFWIANGQLATVSEVMYTLRTALPSADLTVVESGGDV